MTALASRPVRGLRGTARAPGDKSISHRSLMLGAMAHGETTVTGMLEGEDVICTAKAMVALGAQVAPPAAQGAGGGRVWRITGFGDAPRAPRGPLFLGNSGTSARLLMGLVAGYPVSATFTGDESLSRRPMGRVIAPLSRMGAQIEAAAADRLPLRVTGTSTLRSIDYTLPVASAQVKSAVILAGLRAQGETVIVEPVPTRDHSERMLAHFGADIRTERGGNGENVITVKGGARLSGRVVAVPADPSSAAFPAVAALVTEGSDIVIPGVLVNPLRTGLYDTLAEMGADIVFENRRDKSGEPVADLRVRSSALRGVTVPPQRVPSMIDEFPVLSVAAACAQGKTVMTGLAELRVKESDRLAVMARGLAAAGVKLEEGEDSLVIHGTGRAPQGGCAVATHLDHRIAMSFLVLGMAAQEPVCVDDASPINTSFPGFAALMNGLGADIIPEEQARAAV